MIYVYELIITIITFYLLIRIEFYKLVVFLSEEYDVNPRLFDVDLKYFFDFRGEHVDKLSTIKYR